MSQTLNLPDETAELNYLLRGILDPNDPPYLKELYKNLEINTKIMSAKLNPTQFRNVNIRTEITVNGERVPGEWKLSSKLYKFVRKDISLLQLKYIPGIGATTANKLRDKNITPLHVWKAFWYFLERHPNDEKPFITWMRQVCGASERSVIACYCGFYISFKAHTSLLEPNQTTDLAN